mgnify:CR=1 FL=1
MLKITSETIDGQTFTLIGSEKDKRYLDIPADDARKIEEFYSQHPALNPPITPREFLFGLSNRMYTEWCMSDARDKWHRHNKYHGEAFIDFIRNETHYEIVRRGRTWNAETQCFFGLYTSTYDVIRGDVLQGFVRHAKDFFEKNEENWKKFLASDKGEEYLRKNKTDEKKRWEYLPPNDSRNLRASLAQ